VAVDVYPLKPTWRNATFLQYLGTVFAVASLGAFFSVAQDEHGNWGLFGWSLLVLAIVLVLAVGAEQRGEPVVAGLLAFIAVVCWAVLLSALFAGLGFDLAPNSRSFFNGGLGLDTIVLELLVIAGAAYALGRFRFPLLVLPIAAVAWYAVMDLLEGLFGGGNTATAILAILVGLVYVLIGAAYDGSGHHPYAFWLHVVGGLSVGGGILWFWHEHTWEWLLVLIVSLVYIAVARSLGRSSYAVLGAIGLAGTATYFIEKWFSLGSLVPFFPAEPDDADKWGRPLVYLALGAVFIFLGILVERGRDTSPPATEPPAEPAPTIH
jgi:hypothetical protein